MKFALFTTNLAGAVQELYVRHALAAETLE